MNGATHCRRTGKRKYRAAYEANAVLISLRMSDPHCPLRRSYLCPFCHSFHLTSKPNKTLNKH
jgi:hypothetical protein